MPHSGVPGKTTGAVTYLVITCEQGGKTRVGARGHKNGGEGGTWRERDSGALVYGYNREPLEQSTRAWSNAALHEQTDM